MPNKSRHLENLYTILTKAYKIPVPPVAVWWNRDGGIFFVSFSFYDLMHANLKLNKCTSTFEGSKNQKIRENCFFFRDIWQLKAQEQLPRPTINI